ncbi:MAG: VOC family protein [Solirubrobacterales bacterium]|nr:VOC family protein [Solirubrobacterales bacterium]
MPDYPHGTPSWIELDVADPPAAAEFYGQLFGWTAGALSEEGGGYQMFQQGDAPVAGLMKLMGPQQPPAWATYIAVDDADATSAKVKAAGGQVLIEPMDVMDIGRMGIFADPSGAAFGVWQAKSFKGAGLVNKPVSLCWNEVLTRDRDKVLEFYPKVFDWTAKPADFEPNNAYRVWHRPDGQMVGGAMEMTDEWFPKEVPSHWSVCFAVANTDEIVSKAESLGAKVTMKAMDCPIGRFAGFMDPFGASFTVMQLANGG